MLLNYWGVRIIYSNMQNTVVRYDGLLYASCLYLWLTNGHLLSFIEHCNIQNGSKMNIDVFSILYYIPLYIYIYILLYWSTFITQQLQFWAIGQILAGNYKSTRPKKRLHFPHTYRILFWCNRRYALSALLKI